MLLYFIILYLTGFGLGVTIPSEIPTGWENTTITISLAERISLASDAIELAFVKIPAPNPNGMTESALYSEMADFDILTIKKTQFRDRLLSILGETNDDNDPFLSGQYRFLFLGCRLMQPATFSFKRVCRSYCYAALRAYTAYKNPLFLQRAGLAWDWASRYTLNDDENQNISRNFSIPQQCFNRDLNGGTFNQKADGVNDSILGKSTLWSLLVSSIFADVNRSNQTYLDSAQRAFSFIQNQLITNDFIVQDGIDVKSCNITNHTVPGNSGLTIEGATTLSLLQPADSAVNDSLTKLVSSAILNPEWHSVTGVLKSGGGSYTDNQAAGSMVRALSVWYSTASASALKNVVEGYISAQYNTVIGKAKDPQSAIYAPDWNGPPSDNYKSNAQASAITVLLAGIRLNSTETLTTNTTDSNDPPNSTPLPSPPAKKLAVGAIIGAVLGSVFGVIGLGTVFWYLRRRRAGVQADLQPDPFSVESHPQVTVDRSQESRARDEDMVQLRGAMNQIITLLNQRTDSSYSSQTSVDDSPPRYSERKS
ncbi:hypothetical protein VNI00_019251 [Paramarasmius palmivorus]|uniref:Glycoside hydrolase family 76 protein n=1 Tax=Paramarasmius palmivorus TaxID=297713 RepID=A0AAW0ANH0_9AGAR